MGRLAIWRSKGAYTSRPGLRGGPRWRLATEPPSRKAWINGVLTNEDSLGLPDGGVVAVIDKGRDAPVQWVGDCVGERQLGFGYALERDQAYCRLPTYPLGLSLRNSADFCSCFPNCTNKSYRINTAPKLSRSRSSHRYGWGGG